MGEDVAAGLVPPEGLRPAQLGIVVVGRVVFGHVSATLMDLEQRGFVGIEEFPGSAGRDWLLMDRRGHPSNAAGVLRFEAALLDGLFARQRRVRLSELTGTLVPALNRVRAELIRDAVRHDRLRRWRRHQRTPRGERLLRQIWSFRRGLQALAISGDEMPLELAPYARIRHQRSGGGRPARYPAGPAGAAPRGRACVVRL